MSQHPSWHDSSGRAGSSQQRSGGFRESFIKIVPDELVPPPPPSIAAALARHQVNKPSSKHYDDPYESSRGRDYDSPSSKTHRRDEERINEDRILQEIYLLKKEVNRLNSELQIVKQEQEKQEPTQNLRKDITTIQTEVQTLFAGMSEVSGTEDRVKKMLDKYYEKYDNLKSDVKGIDKDGRHLKDGLKSLEKEVKSLKAELKAFNAIFGDFSELEVKFDKYKGIETKLAMLPKLQSDLDLFHASRSSVHTLLEKFHQYYELEKRLQKLVQIERRLSDFGPVDDFSKTLLKIEDSLLKKISKVDREVARMEPYDKVKCMKSVEDYVVKMIQKLERKLTDKMDVISQKSRSYQTEIARIENVVGMLKRKADESAAEEPKPKAQKTSGDTEQADGKANVESKTTFASRTFNFEILSEKEMRISGTYEGKTKTFTATIGEVFYAEFLLDSFLDPRLKQMSHIIVEFAITKEDGKQTEHFSRAWFGKKPKSVRARDIKQARYVYSHGFFVNDEKTARVHLLFENSPLWLELKAEDLTVDGIICSDLKKIRRRDYPAINYLLELNQLNAPVVKGAILTGAVPPNEKVKEESSQTTKANAATASDEMAEFNPNEMIVLDAVYDSEQVELSPDSTRVRNEDESVDKKEEPDAERKVDEPTQKSRRRRSSNSETSGSRRERQRSRRRARSKGPDVPKTAPTEKPSGEKNDGPSEADSSSRWRPKSLDKSGDVFHAFVNIPRKPTDPEDLERVPSDLVANVLTDPLSPEQNVEPEKELDQTPESGTFDLADENVGDAVKEEAAGGGSFSAVVAESATVESGGQSCDAERAGASQASSQERLAGETAMENKDTEMTDARDGTGDTSLTDQKVEASTIDAEMAEIAAEPLSVSVEQRTDNEEAKADELVTSVVSIEGPTAEDSEDPLCENVAVKDVEKNTGLKSEADTADVLPHHVETPSSKSGTSLPETQQDASDTSEVVAKQLPADSSPAVDGVAEDADLEPKSGDTDALPHDMQTCRSTSSEIQPGVSDTSEVVTREVPAILSPEAGVAETQLERHLSEETTGTEVQEEGTSAPEPDTVAEVEAEGVESTSDLPDVERDVGKEKQVGSHLTTVKTESDDIVSDDIVLALAKAADELVEGFILTDQEKGDEAVSGEPVLNPAACVERENVGMSDDLPSAAGGSAADALKGSGSWEKIVEGRLSWPGADKQASVLLSDGRKLNVPREFILQGGKVQCFGDDISVLVRVAEVKLENESSICEVLGVYLGFNKKNCQYRKTPLISAEEIEEEETALIEVKSLNVQGKNGLFLTGKHRGVLVHIPKTALAGREVFDIIRADVTLRPNGVFSFDNVSSVEVQKRV